MELNNNNRPYVLWRRVSTKEQGDSMLGLEAQTAIAEYFMRSEPAKTFTDVYTGTKLQDCPNLQRAIKMCNNTGYLLVVAKSDRFRNTVDGLTILDDVGEGNLCFCDLATTDRTVLTMMFAMWERQAIMGRINTKIALQERIKQRDRDGSWISKSGNVCTRLGRPPRIDANGNEYYDMSAAIEASAQARVDRAIAWREKSSAVIFARRKRAESWTIPSIVSELGQLYDVEQAKIDALPDKKKCPNPYGTPKGCKPSAGTISKWLSEANPLVLIG